ncbi:hypothetical protein MPTK1_7g12470 [Marchantia polymorpha subsp. ruderalis]|uniref:SCP domain-containing protein n=2 Tax=Marchantia polymorpha TaxID=3197 RepID=A0AAF6BYS7_MARPO|nr:hypothetical protein MARPO_0003s0255 [Marchantia polymorpha]BBN17161.1 hypothetical protein Mp_7g12470 [Marchantia polymorpha subsp. ruderalis]|eukprot:PTQ49395.1 hypothetical protein MARPO_0003s0255 [Marchantia polymorpha]
MAAVSTSSIINVAQGQSTADEYLTPHNDARAGLNQGIPSLTWDSTLESYATDWAVTRAAAGDDCALIHSGGPYGENIYRSSGPSRPGSARRHITTTQQIRARPPRASHAVITRRWCGGTQRRWDAGRPLVPLVPCSSCAATTPPQRCRSASLLDFLYK